TYTPTGQRASMSDRTYVNSDVCNETTTYSYDARDRLTKKAVTWAANWNDPSTVYANAAAMLNYGYDANGNVTNIASGYANGVNLAYAYDPLNRLTNVLSHGQPAAGYSYDLAGNLVGMTYGNGVTNRYQYDSLNRLTNLVWGSHSSSLANFGYTV